MTAVGRQSIRIMLHRPTAAPLISPLLFIIIIFTVMSLSSSSTPSSSSSQTSQRPNIIFILADDYGFHDIGYHGSRIRTPNLDRLAAQGVRLENYYVQPICTPTRSQLMSGRYQIHTGLQHGVILANQPYALPRDSPTLADKLQEAGYSTHMVGKWHLGFYKDEYIPTRRGFESFYGFLGGAQDYYTHQLCRKTACGLDLYNNTQPVFTENGTYSAHLFTQRAISIIQQHATPSTASSDANSEATSEASSEASSKPLFLYLAYQSVHSPLQVPEEYVEPYQDIEDQDRRTYAGMVTCMDEAVGNLTAALQKASLMDNTLIVFSSDNGGKIKEGGNNWPLRGAKRSLWEGGVRAVGFVHSPRLLTGGVIHKGFMHVSDWFPTLVQGVAGGHLNGTQPLDGHNQWDSLRGLSPTSPRTELLHNIDILHPLHGTNKAPGVWDTRVQAAVRVGDMKLITGDPGDGSWVPPPEGVEEGEEEEEGDSLSTSPGNGEVTEPPPDAKDDPQNIWLFNITADPQERHDLSGSHPELVDQLLRTLARYNATAVPPLDRPGDPNADPSKHGGVWGPWVKDTETGCGWRLQSWFYLWNGCPPGGDNPGDQDGLVFPICVVAHHEAGHRWYPCLSVPCVICPMPRGK